MDLIAREILRRELTADAKVIANAVNRAATFLGLDTPGHLEAAAYELHRGYNVMEQALERGCRACENHLDPGRDYHERLLERLELDLPGIRPAFLPEGVRKRLREWKGFRHVVRHAYDLEFDSDRLTDVLEVAQEASSAFPDWGARFLQDVPVEED